MLNDKIFVCFRFYCSLAVVFLFLLISCSYLRGQDSLSDTEKRNLLSGRTVEELYHYAEWLLDTDSQKALKVFELVISRNPEPGLLKKAYFGKGKSLYRLKKYLDSFIALEQSFPLRPITSEISERCRLQFIIGKKIAELKNAYVGRPKGIFRKRENGYQAAIRIFKAVIYNDPQGVIVPQVMLEMGDAYYSLGKFRAAYKTYIELTRLFPENPLVEIARIKAAKCLADNSSAVAGRSRGSQEKEDTLEAERLLKKAEKSDLLKKNVALKKEYTSARNMLSVKAADEQLQAAEFYLKKSDERSRKSGLFVLQEILRRYPGTSAASAAKQKLIELGVLSEGDEN